MYYRALYLRSYRLRPGYFNGPPSFQMKILVHDFAGHPFQMTLSRELAKRGHHVTHAYFAGDTGPKGSQGSEAFHNGGQIVVAAVGRQDGYSKTKFISRLLADLSYRNHLRRFLRCRQFDIILSGNTPLWVQGVLLTASKAMGAGFVYWCQDIYSVAVSQHFEKRLGKLSWPLKRGLIGWDAWLMRQSDHVINITSRFSELTGAWGVLADRTSGIPNGGAIDDLPQTEYDNEWALRNMPSASKGRIIYSGTMGLKHNPQLLVDVATRLPYDVVVIGSGSGYDQLKDEALANLKLLPLQPFEHLSEVLGSGDVLVALIERDAGDFSVPSKILSYLCAGRPIVLAAPRDNLASSIITKAGAGLVVEPEDQNGFVEAVREILGDPKLASQMGSAARQYAEDQFKIENVADRFEAVFDRVSAAKLGE